MADVVKNAVSIWNILIKFKMIMQTAIPSFFRAEAWNTHIIFVALCKMRTNFYREIWCLNAVSFLRKMSKKNVYLSQTGIIKISQFSRRHTDEVQFFFFESSNGHTKRNQQNLYVIWPTEHCACQSSLWLCCFCKLFEFIWAASWQNQQNDLCAQRRLRSAWASAQSDQSLRCALSG